MRELGIRIGGAAGQGVQSAGLLLGRTFVRSGYRVFAAQDAMSRIRGGHNFFQLQVREEPHAAMSRGVDLVVALDKATIDLHRNDVREGGLICCDCESLGVGDEDTRIADVPLKKLGIEHGGRPIFANSVAVGFVLGLVELDPTPLDGLFRELFGDDEIVRKNLAAARAGFELARSKAAARWTWRLTPRPGPPRAFLNGNEAIAFGAIAAGCRFMSAYPMSPATSIITYLAGREDRVGLVTEQAEDEIAAINLAFGAANGGVRAMVATSGGGLALMSETVSLLGVTEVPLVIVNSQRPGPATGLPTRTEQADLLFSIYAGHGEFARVVLAPGNAEQAFQDTIRAFNLADRFQVPAFVLADQHLSESYYTVEPFDLDAIPHETSLLTVEELSRRENYARYAFTESGVSPRAYPGQSEHLVLTDSHEHRETGHATENAELRARMVAKRLRKSDGLLATYAGPERTGPANAQTVVIGWGSSREVLREAVAALEPARDDVALLHFRELWPFPADGTREALRAARRVVVVEGNATGQLAQLIRQFTGLQEITEIHRYDGRPFVVEELAEQLGKMVKA
jgi:2-oxoglutarate ferredoxin oxidoreductase subunit alpha